jgi:hypothetical protein
MSQHEQLWVFVSEKWDVSDCSQQHCLISDIINSNRKPILQELLDRASSTKGEAKKMTPT